MFGKIRKYLLRGLLLPVALLVLLPTALYVPAVQRWACTRAEEYLLLFLSHVCGHLTCECGIEPCLFTKHASHGRETDRRAVGGSAGE